MTKTSKILQRMAVPIKTFAESVAGLKQIPKKAEGNQARIAETSMRLLDQIFYYNFVAGSPNFDLFVGNPVWLSFSLSRHAAVLQSL